MDTENKHRRLKKELGLLDVFCIASGAMISSGLFILPGLAFAKTGPSVILSYIIASILMIPTMFSKIELATAMPKAGGNYFFMDRSMGPRMGMLGGLADWFSLSLKSAFALLGMGMFLLLINPSITEMQIKFVAIACCLFFALINIIGAKLTGKFQIVMVIALISLLVFYVIVGSSSVEFHRFTPFMSFGLGSVFATAGFVFISFAGLTKIVGVAEEIKNPGRNIPRGMFLAWAAMSLFYVLVLYITIGVSDAVQLQNSPMPISLGASAFAGVAGSIVMGVAALLAFATTANAGLLAASRTPLAMGRDELLPKMFMKISKRGTPTVSIIFTSAFMICVLLFLDLENLVKAASTMILLLFVFINLSLIIMRESRIRHYRPKFHAPLYPWIQIAGIIGYSFLIFEMGATPLLLVSVFIVLGLSWYFIYASKKIKREYALLHVIERITGIKSTNYLVDEELREILIERDGITEKRFEKLIKKCEVLDIDKILRPDKFARLIAHKLADKLDTDEEKLYVLLRKRGEDSNIVVHPGIAIFSHIIKGHDKFDIILVRSKKGIILSDDVDPIHAFFVIVASPDQQSFHMHSLMWVIQIAEENYFEEKWINAQNSEELRDIFLSLWRKWKSL